MDLIALADFNLVARHGGFGRAARAAGRPKATLSRRVAELENSLDLRLFERGLAYRAEAPVQWCPVDQTVLANEQVIDGRCERCGSLVEALNLEQWFFAITEYADRLLAELDRRPHVRAVVSGHLHDAFELERPDGPILLGCPATIMAIGHDGDAYEIGVDAVTGGRVLTLLDDGSWSSELLVG